MSQPRPVAADAPLAQMQFGLLTEGMDAPADISTPYTIQPGQSFTGSLDWDDADLVRVDLVAGQSYTFELRGTGSDYLPDPMLGLLDATGTVIAAADDGGYFQFDSRLTFTATQTGTYYLGAVEYGGWAGDYTLSVYEGGVWSMPAVAGYLTDGYWNAQGEGRRAFDVSGDRVITYDVSGLTADAARLAVAAFDAWAAASGLTFRAVTSGADIRLDDTEPGMAAYATMVTQGQTIVSAEVIVSREWVEHYGSSFDGYAYQTFIHEIGHALGLGHAGPYNGNGGYGDGNLADNDSWQASVMSYIAQDENPTIDASWAWIATPMTADLLAIQDLYGSVQLRTGNHFYGDLTNAGGSYGVVARTLRGGSDPIAFTIVDNGGIDVLHLAADRGDQRIDLRAGAHSSAYGGTGNITIAAGTVIENAVAGSGNDVVYGNAFANRLEGRAGNDVLHGFNGNDVLIGGAGADRLLGGDGHDIYIVDGADTVIERAGGGWDRVQGDGALRLADHVEAGLLTGSRATNIWGNSDANRLTGNAAGNGLVGGGGADTLIGGAGNDRYYADAQDVIVEAAGGGIDTVYTGVDHVLGNHVENLVLGGRAARGVGNLLDNRIEGNAADNHLIGLGGADTLVGGAGNDVYSTDGRDTVIEAAGGGVDIVLSSVSMVLGTHLEHLFLTGSANLAAYGNSGNNHLRGNGGANVLAGGFGDDRLTGGGGADRFLFRAGRDIVTDFQNDVDTIEISQALLGARATLADVMARGTIQNGNAVFDLGGGHVLQVMGVDDLELLRNDLAFY